MSSSDLVKFSLAYLRIFLCKLSLMLTLIVERASMLLGIAMFPAESEITFAGETQKADFFLAFPAK